MPTRRAFNKLITGAVCASVLDIETSAAPQKKDDLGLAAQFGFSWNDGKLQMKSPDVHVAGLTIARFTWGWVGLAVAASVLQEIGAAIFGAITNSLNHNGGPSIDEILKKQLEQIGQIVGVALDDNRLREAQNNLDAYTERLGYYLLECRRPVLQLLRDEIIGAKSTLSSLKFAGYGPYMVSTGLALAVIQEQAKVGDGKLSDLRNVFHVMTEAAAKHHQEVQDQIDGELAITTLVTRTNGYQKWIRLSARNSIRFVTLGADYPSFLTEKLVGTVWVYPETNTELSHDEVLHEYQKSGYNNIPTQRVSVADARTRIMEKSTDIGVPMIATWRKASLARGTEHDACRA